MRGMILALLIATWIGPGVVRVEHGPGCLYVGSVLYRCYDAAGVAIIGGPQTDAAYRGSAFTLIDGAHTERAAALWRVWVGVVQR